MNLHDVMTELADALVVIEGLRRFPYWAERIEPPAVIVSWPDPYTFDATFGRGSDTTSFPVAVLVGMADMRSATTQLAAYCDGSGARSVKTAIEAHQGVSYDSARVESVEFSVIPVAGVEYLAATFTVHVIGNGGA